MSACSRKRKLSDENTTKEIDSTPKKMKLDIVNSRDHSFEIELGKEKILKLFASNTVNNKDKDKSNKLMSVNVGKSEWKFEFFQLPIDEKHDTYIFLDGLFGDKLCDWKEYIIKDDEKSQEPMQTSNNFIAVIMDNLGVWRGAILFIIYQLRIPKICGDQSKYLIKIPLTGVDLHFRRQNVGTILVNYMVAIIDKIMNFEHDKYEIIVLVIDEDGPRSFWTKCGFVPAVTYKEIDICHMFEKELMKSKGFVREIEEDLVIMIYAGKKSVDLVLKNQMIEEFVTPKYVNFNQKYCKRDEVEETEKLHKEWAIKKKELEEKKKKKEENEESEDESDEDFDVEEAMKNASSDDDEYHDDDDDDEKHSE